MNPLMNSLYRWTTVASIGAALVLVATSASAFTDANADAKEAAAERANRVVVVAKAQPPKRTAWVPPSAKQLDGFKPVLPPEPAVASTRPQPQTLAKAESR